MDVTRRALKRQEDAAADAAAQAEFNEKKWVWVPDEKAGYLPGWIVKEEKSDPTQPLRSNKAKGDAQGDYLPIPSTRHGKEISLEDASLVGDTVADVVLANGGDIRSVPSYTLSKMNPPKFDRVDDIADLTFLNEAGVVHNLRLRYAAGMIYTYSGLFLISINPYKDLGLYTPQIVAAYRKKRRDEAAPHIFATAERAWVQMGEERECQSILITGESGAGKTENTKKVIQYLAAIAPSTERGSATPSVPNSPSGPSIAPRIGLPHSMSFKGKDQLEVLKRQQAGTLEDQILQANPILEAFGNAQTLRNNNSSRFGKFIRILFTSAGAISGANVDWYLLEKSRVTFRSTGERNFHVFYQLLGSGRAEKSLRDKLLLSDKAEDYEYLRNSRTTIDGVDDSLEWRHLKTALATVGFSPEEQFEVFRFVAAILHIGNIETKGDRSDQAYIASPEIVEKVCHLLGVSNSDFSRAVLKPKVKAGREIVTQARTKRQADEELGALCKHIYEKAFGGLVDRINRALDRPALKSLFIGVLDIAGFEIFEVNGYEQLLINYTNERLQQYFNHHMFILEQEEYGRENIEWSFVNFGLDLQPTIELIESTQPIGILSTLDEECIMPKATDNTFLEKLKTEWDSSNRPSNGAKHPGSANFQSTRFGNGFIVKHYAGPVEYSTEGWLAKNKDPINDDVAGLLSRSTQPTVAAMFAEYGDQANASGFVNGKRVKRGAFRTAAQKHREQLTSLVNQLGSTQPHFVRCIVPNSSKKPSQVDVPLVLDQLRCNGVLEGIRIARLGYPNRLPFVEFRQRYEVLCPNVIPKGYMDGRKACLKITEALDLAPDVHKMGLTKIFFKAGVLADLEERRDGHLYDIFARFQSTARRSIARRKLNKLLNRAMAIRTIQRNARTYIELRDWPWWQLFNQVKPLLAATREDDQLAKKRTELALAKERAERDEAEKVRLAELQTRLQVEKQTIEASLAAERQTALEKDGLLQRSKQTESELQEEVQALQGDIDMLEEHLEAAETARLAAEARSSDIRAEFEAKMKQNEDFQERDLANQHKLAEASERLLAVKQALAQVEREKAELQAKLMESSKLAERTKDDLVRIKGRLREIESEAEVKVKTEKNKVSDLMTRMEAIMREMKSKEERLTTITVASAEYETMIKRKDADLTDLRAEVKSTRTQLDDLKRKFREADMIAETAKKDLQSSDQRNGKLSGNLTRLQQELDGLRKLMSAKQSEDAQRKEVEQSQEKELLDLRGQLDKVSQQERAVREATNKATEEYKKDLKNAQDQVAKQIKLVTDLTNQLTEARDQLAKHTSLLSTTAKVTRGLEVDLAECRKRLIARDGEYDFISKAKNGLERQLDVAKSKLTDHEEAILVMEREKVDWAGRLDSVNRDLRAERNRSEAAESELRNLLAETKAMRQQAEHAKAVAKLQDDEIALLRSRENKTIVEHVHVLEKAKKVTDRELAATKAERDQLSSVLRSMEQQKIRLIGDIEDMARQNELLRSDIRSAQKNAGPSPEDLNREKEARQKAEARVAQAVPQTEELNKLKAQVVKQQDTIVKLEKEIERSTSRSLPQGNEIVRLQAQTATYQDQVTKLQKDLTSAKEELDRANALALKNTQTSHRTMSGPSPSIKALQELHLGNEQLSKSMAEELRRNRLGPLAEASGRVRNENNRHSLDIGSMRTMMTTLPDDTGNLAAAQQKMARDLQQLQADLQNAQMVAKEAQKARTDADARRAAVEKRLKDLQDNTDDSAFDNAAGFAARLNKEMEKERARYQKDLQDFERTVHQTRTKYQAELAQLTEDLGSQRDDMLRYKEANRLLKAKEEELRRELEDELHSSSGWKREKERLESRIGKLDLNTALEAASSNHEVNQGQHVKHVAQMKELRRKLDESETECSILRQAKQKLEERANALFDKELKTSRLDQNRAVQQLSLEKQEVQAALDSANDKINLVKQKQARSEAYAAECLQELGKVRKVNTDVDRRNTALEKEVKALQVKIVDLETQSYANSPVPGATKRLESKLREVQMKLDAEIEDRNEALRQKTIWERQSRDYQSQVKEMIQQQERLLQERGAYERAIGELQTSLKKAIDAR